MCKIPHNTVLQLLLEIVCSKGYEKFHRKGSSAFGMRTPLKLLDTHSSKQMISYAVGMKIF